MTEILEGEIVDGVADDSSTESLKKINPARSAIKFVATSSVRFVVSSAITTLVPVETKKEKRKVFIASMVLSGMINEKVKPYVDTEIDDAIEMVREVVKQVKKLDEKRKAEAAEADVPNP